jgi:hypothetical protein
MDYESLWWMVIVICGMLILVGFIKMTWAFWEGFINMI